MRSAYSTPPHKKIENIDIDIESGIKRFLLYTFTFFRFKGVTPEKSTKN